MRFSTTKKFKENGVNKVIVANIRLDDPCKNGHNDFSITGDIGYKRRGRRYDTFRALGEDWEFESGGCIHEEILKRFPKLKPFTELHLSNDKGAPMHAAANGFYHLKKSGQETTIDYLRITEEEYNELLLCEDETYFKYKLYQLGIVSKWEDQAKKAISLLEELTGEKYISPENQKLGITPLTDDEVKEIEGRPDGYYSVEEIQKREAAKVEFEISKRIQEIKADERSKFLKMRIERQIKIAFVPFDIKYGKSWIYYDHRNEIVFNWSYSSNNLTEEQIQYVVDNIDKNLLPSFVVFKCKDKMYFPK